MSIVPPSLARLLMLRDVAKEPVTSSVAGTTAALPELSKNIALLATVSPRLALLLTEMTPELTWVANIEFTPLRTSVPWPVLNKVPAPLMLLALVCTPSSPAPMSKPTPELLLPVST